MKPLKWMGIAVLAAAPSFAQATAKVERVLPNCGTLNFLDQLTSGCYYPRIQVTASSSNGKVIGFMVTISYREANGVQSTVTQFVTQRTQVNTFVASIPDPLDIISMQVTAIELIAGQQVEAQ